MDKIKDAIDELREYVERCTDHETVLLSDPPQHRVYGVREDFDRLIGKLEQVHIDDMAEMTDALVERDNLREGNKRLVEEYNTLLEWNTQLAKREVIELPKDADGEYLHIGDVMDNSHKSGFDAKVVIGISYHEGGKVCVRIDEERLRWLDPTDLKHHHEPTVADVLREFALKWGDACDEDAYVDEYAKKLRMADGGK